MAFFLRRAFARFTDYLLWGMLTVTVLGDQVGNIYSPSLPFYASFWIYVFIEAALISSFGTTLGKKLTGIYVLDRERKNLSFFTSLKRSFCVFGGGLGFFLPYISLIAPLCVAVFVVKRRTFPWDTALPDTVDCVRITVWNKLLLAAFVAFLGTGYFITARLVFLYQKPDFTAVEEGVLRPYFEKIRPQIVEALSEESVLSPQAAVQTLQKLESIQQQLQQQQEELRFIGAEMQKQLDKMPAGEWKALRKEQISSLFEKINGFLFAEGMRIRLFKNILNFFQDENKNKYTLVDGRPVFEDPELKRQYDNYMMQLQNFLMSEEEAD